MRYCRHTLQGLIWLALVVAVGLAFASVPAARAQENIVIESLLVRLWPEFDDASMLVILNGQISTQAELPVNLRIPIPPGVRINAVASEDPTSGVLSDAPYEVQEDVLLVTSPNGSFHVEFYDPALDLSQPDRAYTLTWTPEYDVTEVVIEAQQPVGATNFTLDPAGGVSVTDQFGLPNLRVIQSGPAAGEPLVVTVSYTKNNSTLTAQTLEQQAPSQPDTSATGGGTQWIAYVLVGVGVLLIGGGVFWYVRTQREDAPQPRGKRGGAAKADRFCTQCGQPVSSQDRFCRHCGATLRDA